MFKFKHTKLDRRHNYDLFDVRRTMECLTQTPGKKLKIAQ